MQRASRFFACLTLVGMSCWVAAALFAAPPASDNSKGSGHHDRANAAARDSEPSPPASTRGQSPERALSYRELVAQGRQAFDRGQYDVAEALARQALAKKRPGPLGRLLAKDSPQKLLRDLEKVRANKKADADRAWAEQEQADSDPDAYYSGTGTAPVGDAKLKQTVAALIEQAYVQLQQGNTSTAYQLAMQAKGFHVRYAPGEQTPDDVLRAIAASERRDTLGAPQMVNPVTDAAGTADRAAAAGAPAQHVGAAPEPVNPAAYETVSRSTAAPADASAVAQSPAEPQSPTVQDDPRELVHQARRAMAHGQFDEARSLAQQAKLHRYAPASPQADSPDTILHQIDEFRRIVNEGKSGFDRDYVLRQQHDWLLELAGRLRDQADLDLAAAIARQAADLKVPAAGPGAMTASRMLAEIEQQAQGATPSLSTVPPDAGEEPAGGYEPATSPDRAAAPLAGPSQQPSALPALSDATPGSWGPTTPDPSQNTRGTEQSAPSAAERARAALAETDQSDAHREYELGVQAMRRGDHSEAIAHLQAAWKSPSAEPQLKQRIQDHLSGLYAQSVGGNQGPVHQAVHQDPLAESPPTGQLRTDRVEAEATQALIEANRLQQAEKPDEALAKLNQAKTQLTAAGRQHPELLQLLRRVNERIADIEKYKEQNAAALSLREQNRATEEQIHREHENEIAVQKELAELVDQFNQLMDDRRFAEAEKVAEKAAAIAPDEPVTQSMVLRGRMRSNIERDIDQQNRAARAFEDRMYEAQESRIASVGDEKPMVFSPNWQDLIKRRKAGEDRYSTRTEAEQQIEQALRTKVTLKYDGTPLVTVLEDLAKQAGINLVIDQQAFVDENISSDTPVKIDVDGIMLKSALKIILDDVHLIYVIREEVLKITSESRGRGELVPVVYPVGDLVLPIPNFVPGGAPLGTMLKETMLGGTSPLAGTPLAMGTPINNGSSDVPRVAQNILAQLGGGAMAAPGSLPSSAGFDAMGQPPFGSAGEMITRAGGAANADFDSLMDLIKETIEPESWDDVGGPGSMEPFPLNLALIISQTEEVHDRIASLLEQLRRLLDLQLAVEVRFVTLTDNFFERIGIDFDFDINDNADKPFQVFGRPDPNFTPVFAHPSTQDAETDNPGRDLQDRDHQPSQTVGMSAPGIFSVDLDIPFRQNSFSLGVPTFGGFTADAGAQMGFAILSDIEAYFFINAAQADRRTNIVQAPKVVMFNGQSGIVADFSARPFLIGVIPLIGAGSVGFTPIIRQFPTGAIVAVTGIISADRRYVRLTVFPFFFQLGEVFTLTTNLGAVGGGGGLIGGGGAAATVPVTLQLPVQSQTFVITTVNVPDGGTVLLGGVKRVNEGRTEAGVPVLNKLPYVNRLFKNVGTGRETQSLMLMVTPRIIIGEEEESLLGVSS